MAEIDGPGYGAAGVVAVFTAAVSDGASLRAVRWTVAGPDGFAASSDSRRFEFTAPAGGDHTVRVEIEDAARRKFSASTRFKVFGDIAGHLFVDEILWLAAEGITLGCGSERPRYCPDDPVTRAQMASFLARALDLERPERRAGFDDVDPDGVHAANIEALYAARITLGCGAEPLRYCPDDPVPRAQMAAFLYRARGLIANAT